MPLVVAGTRARPARADAEEASLEQRRCTERRREHDEEQRGVEVLAEARLHGARSSRRSARPRRAGSCRCRRAAGRRGSRQCRPRHASLPSDGDDEQHRGDRRAPSSRPNGLDVGVDADLQEEDRDEQVPDRRELAADAVRRAGCGRARGRRRTHRRSARAWPASASSANASVNARRARRACPPSGCSAGSRRRAVARSAARRMVATTRNPIATTMTSTMPSAETRSLGHEAHDHRQDDEAQHVVGDRGAEHRPRLDRSRARAGRRTRGR